LVLEKNVGREDMGKGGVSSEVRRGEGGKGAKKKLGDECAPMFARLR